MPLLIYILVTIIVCFIACIPINFKEYNNETKNDYKMFQFHSKTPWFAILLIAIVLTAYSKSLGITDGLIDRVNYTYSFLYRYPNYYKSLGSIFGANTEAGIVIISMFISKVTNDAIWLFSFVTFVTSLINLYVISKLSRNFVVGVALMMCSLFFVDSTYLIRQSLAIAFANLAILSYIKKKKFFYFVLALISCLFHSSAIILYPLYFLFKYFRTKRTYVFLFLIFIFLFISFGKIMNLVLDDIPYINRYIEMGEYNYYFGGGSTATFLKGIPFYIITMLSILHRDEIKKQLAYADIYIASSVIYSMSWLFTFNLYWFYRIGWFFLLPTLLLVPTLFHCIREKKAHMLLCSFGISFMIFVTLRQIYITLF